MAVVSIINPLPQFNGLDGRPLNGGRLYFGVANANPETAPQTVYWDAALTQPASQPVATVNGAPARNGAAARLYIAGDYSLTVRDSLGRQVQYAPTSLDGTFSVTQRRVVIGTGVAATDTATLQAAINAAGAYEVIELFGSFTTNATITIKPQITLRNGDNARITHTVSQTLFKLDVADGFPGQIIFDGLRLTGPGAPVSGEALGTLTWANLWAAIQIETNAPYIQVRNCYVEGWFAGVVLRGAYCSSIGGAFYNNRHGVMLYGECHNTVLDNPLIEGLGSFGSTGRYVTGLSVNYGAPAGKTNLVQSICTRSGAYQGLDVGIWVENSQGFSNAGRIYFETNRQADIVLGAADAGGYARKADFAHIDGANIASPCGFAIGAGLPVKSRATGCNIQIHHSSGVVLRNLGHYPGSGAPSNRAIFYADGFCGPIEAHWDALVEGTNLFDLTELPVPYRVKIGKPGGRTVTPQFTQFADQFGPPLSPYAEGFYPATEVGGRALLSLGKPLADNVDVFFGPRATLAGSRAGLGIWNGSEQFVRWLTVNPTTAGGQIELIRPIVATAAAGVMGQDAAFPSIAAAATIAPSLPFCVVTGAGSITTVTVPSGWPNGGRLVLLPAAGATWTLATGGNLNRAASPTVGRPVELIWYGAASQWLVKE